MRDFYQFMESITHHNKIDSNSKMSSILKKLPHRTQVEFALYCAEDAFKYNNEDTKNAVKTCIDLIKKWLSDSKSVTIQQLNSASDDTYVSDDVDAAASYAAGSAAAGNANAVANYAAGSADAAADTIARFIKINNPQANYSNTYNLKLQEYKQYLSLLASHSSTTLKNPQIKNFLQKPDKTSIAIMLDFLGDHDEDLVTHDPKTNMLKLNLPHGHEITGKDHNDLAEKIMKYPGVLNWLQRTYQSENNY